MVTRKFTFSKILEMFRVSFSRTIGIISCDLRCMFLYFGERFLFKVITSTVITAAARVRVLPIFDQIITSLSLFPLILLQVSSKIEFPVYTINI